MTKKEKDLIEVTALIQKAANQANNLFDQSAQFKMNKKKQKPDSAFSNSRRKSGTRSHIKTNDPFKNLPPKTAAPANQDSHILSNLDKIINDLQS